MEHDNTIDMELAQKVFDTDVRSRSYALRLAFGIGDALDTPLGDGNYKRAIAHVE